MATPINVGRPGGALHWCQPAPCIRWCHKQNLRTLRARAPLGLFGVARLAGVEPAARGFEVRRGEDTAAPAASRSVTLRGVSSSPTSPNVPPHPANHGEFAALVLQGFSGRLVSPREAA